jgi:TetR/AcrR family transcriptional repressor of nem operon
VLQKAMNVFWTHGYEATSMQVLVDAMGIKRQSLYDTFGDKQSLYRLALDRYRLEQENILLALLAAPGSVRKKLEKVLYQAIDEAITDETRRGCFMNNAMTEMVSQDEKTAEQAFQHMSTVEHALEIALTRGQKSGEITGKHDARALARYFFNALNGLHVVSKTNPDKTFLEDIVKVTLEAFI